MQKAGRQTGYKKIRPIKIAPYIFIAPAVIYIFAVTLIPVLMALPISFTNWLGRSARTKPLSGLRIIKCYSRIRISGNPVW